MESEVLSERGEWEARRVAAAFGVKEWDTFQYDNGWDFAGIGHGGSLVGWAIERSTGDWLGSEVGPKEVRVCDCTIWRSHYSSCQIARHPEEPQEWGFEECIPEPRFNELMACGLYCLGIEDESVLSHLTPLSAHEKMELRLSMPREFWPKMWLDEDASE